MTEPSGGSWYSARGLASLWLLYFVIAADQVALPSAAFEVTRDLSASISIIQSALALFSVFAVSLYLVTGRIGDVRGRRFTVVLAGLLLLTGEILVCVSTRTDLFLVGWSVLRGLGLSLLLPNAFAALASCPPARRDRAFAIFAVAGPAGAVLGPLLIAIASRLHWRLAFVVECVIIAAALVLARWVDSRARRGGTRIDPVSAGLGVVATASVILAALSTGDGLHGYFVQWIPIAGRAPAAMHWVPPLVIMMLGGIATILLVRRTRTLSSRGTSPLLALNLFANLRFMSGWLVLSLVFFSMSSLAFVVPVYVQAGLGFDTSRAGLSFAVYAAGILFGGLATTAMVRRIGVRTIVRFGTLVLLLGLGGVAFVATDGRAITALLPVAGVGLGALLATAPNLAMSAVGNVQRGDAGGLGSVGEECGVGLGVAVGGGMLIGLGLDAGAFLATLAVVAAAAVAIVFAEMAGRRTPARPNDEGPAA